MRLRTDIELGVATHSGQVRSTNEDDYLILAPLEAEGAGRLFAVADGMGGVVGGAEASRVAVRSLGGDFVGNGVDDPEERMRGGFARACSAVYEMSRESPRLSEMGTTMTALNLIGERGVIGHVGDSRCLRWRRGRLAQLTEDHAMTEPRNMLTRCIGAGQASEEVDIKVVDVAPGDVFLLITDGVWTTVDDSDIARALRSGTPQETADRLIDLANENGAPDNGTAMVISIRAVGTDPGAPREIDLPGEELPQQPALRGSARNLTAPRWPWVVLGLSLVVAALTLARNLYGIDLLGRIVDLFR